MKNLFYLITICLLSSCVSSKLQKTLEQGSTLQEKFKTTIPFEYRQGIIVLKVEIENVIYDFALDTGASNILSQELVDKLNLKPLGSENVLDIHSESQNLKYTKLDQVRINGIDFVNTIAAITDYNKVAVLSCLGVDGFIGANLMRHAVWDFDFDNQMITITNNEDQLNIPSNYSESKLFIGFAGLASIITEVNGEKSLNNVIDFGNNGLIKLSPITFIKQRKKNKITKLAKARGYEGVGIYGSGKERTFYKAKIDNIKIGNFILEDEIVSINEKSSGNLGINFFKNYRIILNWSTKRLKMIEKKPKANNELSNFGFNPTYIDNKLFVGTLFENTKAAKLLKLGDQILFMNDKEYTHIATENFCEVIKDGYIDYSLNTITVVVLRDNKELKFELDKQTLL